MASVAVVVQTISLFVTPNCRAKVSNKNTTTKKSNASSVQPRNPASTAWREARVFSGESWTIVQELLSVASRIIAPERAPRVQERHHSPIVHPSQPQFRSPGQTESLPKVATGHQRSLYRSLFPTRKS